MTGKFIFLCLMATTLGGIPLPDKPFNPDDRLYTPQYEYEIKRTSELYSTTIKIPVPKNRIELKSNNKKPDTNSKETEMKGTESESNSKEFDKTSKEFDLNSKKPELNSKELEPKSKESGLNSKELKPNSKKSVSPKSKEFETKSKKSLRQNSKDSVQNSKKILHSSQKKEETISKESRSAESQESAELLSPVENPKLKTSRKQESEESDLTNKESDVPNIESFLTHDEELDLNNEEPEKLALRLGELPILRASEEFVKIPKDFFVKWVQQKVLDNIDSRKKRIKNKFVFIPDNGDNEYLYYNSVESNHDYGSDRDGDNNSTLNDEHNKMDSYRDQIDRQAKSYNKLLAKIFAAFENSQKNQSQNEPRDHKAHIYKELLAKIFELLLNLPVESSYKAHTIEDQKAKRNKELISNIITLLQILLEKQNSPPGTQKTKINKELLTDIFALLQILTEEEGQDTHQSNVHDVQKGQMNKKLLSNIFALYQNLPEEQDQSASQFEIPKAKNTNYLLTQLLTIFNLQNGKDQNTPQLEGKKPKINKELLTQLTIFQNLLKEQDPNTSFLELQKAKDEKLAQILAIIQNSQKAQDLNKLPVEGQVNKEDLTHLLAIFQNSQKEQNSNASLIEGQNVKNEDLAKKDPNTPPTEEQHVNNEKLAQMLALFQNPQKEQNPNRPPIEGQNFNNEKLAQMITIFLNSQKEQDSNTPLIEGQKVNNELLPQLLSIFQNLQKEQDPNTLEGEKAKAYQEQLAQLIAIYDLPKETDYKTPGSVEGDQAKVAKELLGQLVAIFNLPKDQDFKTLEGDKIKKNKELLSEIIALFQNLHKEQSQSAPVKEQSSNINNKILAKIIAIFQNIPKVQDQKILSALQQPASHNAQVIMYQQPMHALPPTYDYQTHQLNHNEHQSFMYGQSDIAHQLGQIQGYNFAQGQNQENVKQKKYIDGLFLAQNQNQASRTQPNAYGSNEIRLKLMQLIKDTMEDIDLKAEPIRSVHEAYKSHRLYKIGFLISSINRTHDSVIDFHKYIQQNINGWDIIKVLQAYEQVKTADQFLTKALQTLSIICGNPKITELQQRALQRSQKKALEHSHDLARRRNHTNELEDTQKEADPATDLEDTHDSPLNPKMVVDDLQKRKEFQRIEMTLKNTYNKTSGRDDSPLNHNYDIMLQRNQKNTLKDVFERSLLEQKRALGNDRGRTVLNEKKRLDHNNNAELQRTLQRNLKEALKARALDNRNNFFNGISGPVLQRNQKTLKDKNGRALAKQNGASKGNYELNVLRDEKRDLLHNEKINLKSNYGPGLENYQNVLKYNYDQPLSNLKKASDLSYEAVIQDKQKRVSKDVSPIRDQIRAYKLTRLQQRLYYPERTLYRPQKSRLYYSQDMHINPSNKKPVVCNASGQLVPCNNIVKLSQQQNLPLSWSYYGDY